MKHLGTWLAKSHSLVPQFARYTVVGGIATVFDYGTFIVLARALGWHYLLANACAFLVGIAVNYTLSTRWVFNHRNVNSHLAEFIVFAVVGVVGLGISQCTMLIGVEWVGLNYALAKLFAVGTQFIWNFGARKALLFRNKTAAASPGQPEPMAPRAKLHDVELAISEPAEVGER